MLENSQIEITCQNPECREHTKHEVAWFKNQTTMLCPFCGAEMTSELHQMLRSIENAEKGLSNDWAKLNKGEN